VPNTAIVELGTDGTVDLKNNSKGTTDLVADLEGYYAASGDGYIAHMPTRLVDTRTTKQTLAAGGTLRVYLGSTGESAAVLNVTVTGPTSNGFITAYPDGVSAPNASNVNYGPHQTIASEVLVRAGADGYVDFKNTGSGSTDLVVDMSGLFEPGSGAAFVPLTPTRILDTRSPDQELWNTNGPLPGGTTGELAVAGNPPAPPVGATAAVENVTVTEPASNGYVLAYSDALSQRPIGSTLNFGAGQTVANAATVGLGTDGGEDIYNASAGSTQLVVDLFGYYF
jgi:hypothetical protein